MNRAKLINVFLRSLTIHGSLNFWRMQNIGYAFSMIPVVRELAKDEAQAGNMLTRHVQAFNTHPYLSAPLIGSVIRVEESMGEAADAGSRADEVKNAMMAPYAGIGDPFFWGSLRPLASFAAVTAAVAGCAAAPLVFLLVYTPLHLWIRIGGFIEGYRHGREGIVFIRDANLPRLGSRLRFVSLFVLAFLAVLAAGAAAGDWQFRQPLLPMAGLLVLILAVFAAIKKRVSPVAVLYGLFACSAAVSFFWKGP